MKQRLRRPLALLLTVVMLLGLLPTAAFAVEGEEPGEPVTASAPEDIILENKECNVGDRVTLDGATTVDSGTLSYQWYQSGDGSVDDADAAGEEKNGTPLDGETESTLTVNTSEVGTFYYYVVATNTVTLEDGETDTASTTSNVATVTVNEAEPVPPSENSEPEDGQEPSNGSAAEGEQAPENDGEEPGPNDQNDGASAPPTDAVDPATSNNSNPESEGNGETKITEMTLKNFTPFNGETAQDVDLLNQSEPLSWEATGSNTVYTIDFAVALEDGVEDKSLRITLPYGMQFVGLIEKDGVVTNIESLTIESVGWERSKPVYGNGSNSNYQRNNGTLIVHFPDEGASSSSFSINVQPDVAFLPTDQKDGGFLIEDAIQAQVQVGDHTSEPESVDVKLFAVNGIVTSNGGWNKSYSVVAGTSDNKASVTVYWQYLFPDGGGAISYFMDKAVLIYAVPNVFTITDASMSGAAIQEISASDDLQGKYPDCTFYRATYENFYGAQSPFTLTFSVDQSAETDKTYIIYPISTEVTAYGQDSSSIYSFDKDDATNQVKIKVIDPEKTYLEMKVPSITLTNYTELGNEAGNFDDYNMLLSYVEITNSGADNTGPLIYEARFDSDPDLIRTAIRIPCQADSGEYPTELTIYYGNGQSTTLNGEAIQGIATILNKEATYSGIEIQLADVTGLQAGAQVTGFKAQISGLNKGYENGKTVQERYTSAVIGRIAAGVGHNTTFTDNYRVYSAKASEDDIPEYTKVPITISNTPGQIASTSNMTPKVQVNGETQTTAQPGDTIQISDIGIAPTSYYGATRNMLVVDPIFYIIEPAGLNLSSVSFTDGDGNPVYATKTEVSPTNGVEIAYGGKLYAYQLNNTLSGYWDGDMEARSIQAKVEYNVPYGVQTAAYDLNNLMFWASGISGTSFNTNFPYAGDLYDLNNGKYLGGYKSQTFSVTAPQDLAISSAMQIDGTDEWFVYDGTDSSLAVFGNNTTATVRVTIRNNTNGALDSVEVYVPIPKTKTNLGTNFGKEDGYYFDMYVAGPATVPDNWKVEYGVVESAPSDKQTAPVSEEGWSTSYSDDINMVKISMTTENGLPTGEAVDIDLKLRATSDASQNDKRNLFKSWYSYEASSGSGYDASEVINFGALLQIGELTGTVYADSDRDSTMDTGEQGISNVRVTVTDESGRVYETTTNENGQYTISGLPSKQELTVTVYNPYDHESRAGSYRFSDYSASSGETVGSDVTSADSGQTGTITLEGLTDGAGVVNAGLITPYKVTFNGTGNSTVNPSEIYRFPGEAVGLNGQKVTVQTGVGETFLNKWSMSVNNAEATTIEDNALLSTEITGDTVFTPVIESEKNAVYFMVWDNAQGKLVPLSFENIEYGKTLGSVTDSKFPDMTEYQRPGYTLTGWNVNGVGITIINNDTNGQSQILNTPVTDMISYHAVYTPLSNITVTLNPNYEGAESTVLENQSYGQPISYTIPTREGYTFLGWATTSTATEGSMSLTCPATDTTFYAVWKPGTVRLTLLENGGTWAENSSFKNGYIDGTVGEAVTLPIATAITREGYDFQGWYVQGDTNQAILTDYKFPTKATTLIAKWEPKQESITFDYGADSGITPQEVPVTGAHGTPVGNEQAQELTNAEREGWSLIGWKNEDTGVVTPAANTGSIVIEAGQKYIAQWAQGQSILKFDAGDGAKFPNNGQIKTYYGNTGSTLEHGEPVNPEREGYKFLGWFDATTGGTAVTEFTFPQTANEEKTYYAQWEKETYTVTFRYNGGTLEGAEYKEVPVAYLDKVGEVPTPTNGDANLLNWTDVATGKTYSSEQIQDREVKANTIYSANWNLPSYQVTFGNLGDDPNSTSTVSVTSGSGVFAPDPQTPDGKVFLHWLLTSDPDATKTEYSDQDLAQLQISKDMTFQAVFGEDSYTITFITSNGSFEGGTPQTTITKQGGEKLAENDFPTVTDNTANFTGWYYNGTTWAASEWAGTEVSGNMTFVAAFEGKVTVSFNTMGGKWTDDGQEYANGIEGNAGEAMTLPTAEHITRTGYTFTGWYTDMACTTKAPDTFPGSRTTYYAGWSTEGLSVTVTETPTYDGTPKTPSLTVKVGSITLDDGDYVAIYKNNVDAGEDTATVTVYSVVDAYAGLSGTTSFTIKKAEQTVTFAKPGNQTATYGDIFANTATAQLDSAAAKITYSSSDDSIATVNASTGEVTILKAGEVTITATAAEMSNVKEDKAEYKLTISKATPTLTFANSTVSVKTTGSVNNPLTIVPGGLTVTYSSGNDAVAKVDPSTGEITLVGEGNATITANFAGNDCYNSASASYTLTVDNEAIAYTAEGWHGPYDAKAHGITVTPTVPETGATVTYSKTAEDGTYTTDAPTYTDAGTYTVYFKIEAKGYDTVTGSAKVIIEKAQLTEATVTGGPYTGQQVGSVTEVKAGTLVVPEGSYEVSYVNNVDAGTAVAIITAKADSNFIGNVPKTFTITPKQLTADMVSAIADQPYTGEQIKPDVTVADGSTTLVEGKDFTVSYGDNNTVGTNAGTVTITGTGNYAGTVTKQFDITNAGTFEVIVDNSTLTYDGTEKEPAVTVWAVSDDGKTKTMLTVGTDYEVTYENNINAGTASVTVKGMGAYTESGKNWKDITVYFTIQPAEQSVTFASAEVEKTYGDPAFTQAATVTLNPDVDGQTPGAVTYASSNPAVATVDNDGKVTIVGAGTATITASAEATQNYKGAKASCILTVNPKNINSPDVTASQIPDQPYGGVPVTPDFSLTDSDPDITKHNLEVNVDYTFTYSNNDGEGTGKITITGAGNYTGTKEVTFKIIPWSDSQVVVTPAAITIYMGGADGYEGVVVDEDTGSITASSSLPEPGFLFTLPEMLKDALAANHADLTDITFREPASGKEWTAELYADGASTVYRLVPSGAQEPVRVQFTNAQGQTVTEDKFEVGENINQTLTMTLYKGDVGVIYAIYDGVQYPIRLGKSTLTVRGVTEEAQYAAVTDVTTAPVEGKPAVTAESGTSYTINGSKVQVEDPSGVALLYDSIIDASGENRTGLLEDKAEDTMAALNKEPASGNRFAYSFQYLDLVDTNNGNAWVKASKDVTIFWPYPAGTNKDTAFTLLHFEGLHREMDTSEIGDQIADCNVSKVTIEEKTDTHIVLKVGSAGFSPFALVWEERIPTYTITATSNGNGSITPAGVTTVQEGGSQSYTIKADNGYHISDVKVNGVSVGAVESYTFTNVRSNQTIAVTFSRNSSGGGGGGGGHTKPSDPDEDIPDEPGPADPFDTGVGNWLNTEDHTAYLGGYGGGLFGPDDNMTRGQAAQMFYNLLLDKDVPITVSFTDVAPDAWYATAVNTLASLGIVTGYGNGQFGPDDSITRAQFTTIAMRFAHLDTSGENIFTDVSEDDWFYEFVVGAIKYGWIGGYPDGRFGPNDTITRAQVTTIVNRMLGRSADEDYVERNIEELTRFTDVPDTHWAYYNIMEATNAHDYDRVSGGEDWTRLHK